MQELLLFLVNNNLAEKQKESTHNNTQQQTAAINTLIKVIYLAGGIQNSDSLELFKQIKSIDNKHPLLLSKNLILFLNYSRGMNTAPFEVSGGENHTAIISRNYY